MERRDFCKMIAAATVVAVPTVSTVVYAIVLGWPAAEFMVESLGTSVATKPGKVTNVQLLGTDEKVKWT